MASHKELTKKQITAIKRSINLGRILQNDFPEIAGLYRKGTFLPQIAEILNIQIKYEVSENVANEGVRRAIVGYKGDSKIENYIGLIPDKESKRIGIEHKVSTGRKLHKEKMGIHGKTTEQKKEDGKKGGRKSYEKKLGVHALTTEQLRGLGHKLHQEKRGIHAKTPEQMSEDGRKSAIARGLTPWTDEEKEFAYQLSLNPDYHYGSKVSGKLISSELNIKYHDGNEIRVSSSVHNFLYRYKKSLEERAE